MRSISGQLFNLRGRVLAAAGIGIILALAGSSSSCAPSGFQDPSLLQNGVRILASSATEPYAHGGDAVTVSVLAFDGRTDAQRSANPEPMHIYWLPTLCVNPAQDAYYNCFSQLATDFAPIEPDGGGVVTPDAATDAGVGLDAGFDATVPIDDGGAEDGASDAPDGGNGSVYPGASVVSRISFTIPEGTIIPRVGTPNYGLLFGFNVACAGHLELVPAAASSQNPQALPVGCFDSAEHLLGPESYVFGFTRIYVYAANDPAGLATVNHNPVIESLDTPYNHPDAATAAQSLGVDGGEGPPNLTAAAPFIAPRCLSDGGCAHPKIGPVVPMSSWEVASGGHEEIWADYYSTFGSFSTTTRLLYDPATGAIADPDTEYQPPVDQPADQLDGLIWIVVHDNRGGATWVTVPLRLQ